MHQQRRSLSWQLEELEEQLVQALARGQVLREERLVQQRLVLVLVLELVQQREERLEQSRHRNLQQP